MYFRYHGASSRVLRVSARHAGNYRILIFARRVGRIFLCGCGQPMPRYCVSNGHQRSFDTRLISFWDNYFLYLSPPFFNHRVFFNLKQFRYLKHSVLLRLKKLLNVIFYTRPFHCPHWVAIITLIQWNRSGVIPIVRHFVRFLENTLTLERTYIDKINAYWGADLSE